MGELNVRLRRVAGAAAGMPRGRLASAALAGVVGALVALAFAGAAGAADGPPASFAEYPLPVTSPPTGPWDLTAGPDGSVWIANAFGSRSVTRVTTAGSVTEFPAPYIFGYPSITGGPDGNVWLEGGSGALYRISTAGVQTGTFAAPGLNGGPNRITAGPDGNVWYAAFQSGYIGRMTPAGVVKEFGTGGHPDDIAAGADGNLWFTDEFAPLIGRITPAGSITRFALAPSILPYHIARGADGNVWFTAIDAGAIGRVTPTGAITLFYLPGSTQPEDIAAGADGALWFTDSRHSLVGRMTTGGTVGLFEAPASASYSLRYPRSIVAGPDGRLWLIVRFPSALGAFAPFVPTAIAPEIRRIEPPDSTTNGGGSVTITGYKVGEATRVLFGDTPATSFSVLGPSQVRAVVPAHPAGAVDVTVVTPSGSTAPSAGSKFYYSSLVCGKTITRSTTLAADIGPCYRDGVVVGADGITLDLAGHRIYGFAGPSDGHAAGVRLPKRSNVTVKNGTVWGFDAGVLVRSGGSNTIRGLTIEDNVGPDTLDSELGDGVFVDASEDNTIVDNTVSHNGIYDGIGIYGPRANGNVVERNVVERTVGTSDRGPIGEGIIVNGATGGTTVTRIVGTVIRGNTVRDNASGGISNINHVGGSILDNVVTGNGTTNSFGNGIGVSVGFQWNGAPTRMLVQGNEIHRNGVDGIRIGNSVGFSTGAPTGNTIRDNDAAGNATNPAADVYEGGARAYDLRDTNPDCANNVWFGNLWGAPGYTPACTASSGSGPTSATATATATAQTGDRSAKAKAWTDFLNRGRR